MKRLPEAKRNQLIGVILGTLALIFLVYFFLISTQDQKNNDLAGQIKKETARLDQYTAAIKQVDATTAALGALTEQLNRSEDDVASGDLYQWTIDRIRNFNKPAYHVDIPALGQPVGPNDCDMIEKFPYKQIHFKLNGSAYYHDLGKFIADFENKFPHCRVANVDTAPAGGGPTSGEKLNFSMDVFALVKPNN